MRGTKERDESRTTIKLSAARGTAVEIGFEPIGTSFDVADGDWVILELPAESVAELEFVAWPNGIAVWVPFPGDYVVFDSAGNELERL